MIEPDPPIEADVTGHDYPADSGDQLGTYVAILDLLRLGWQFAGPQRYQLFVCIGLFAIGQALLLCEPLIIGSLINAVQRDAAALANGQHEQISQIGYYLALFLAVRIGFWAVHTPARLLERNLAFLIKTRFKLHLIKGLIELPLKWHKDHHSGESIDKINSASTALFDFYEQSYELIYVAFRFFATLVILTWFMPTAGAVVFFVTGILIPVIGLYFDRVVRRKFAVLTRLDNKLAAAIQDYLVNTVSVITLRLERRVLKTIDELQQTQLPLFRKVGVIGEGKWFLMTTIISLTIVLVLYNYARQTMAQSHVLLAGTFFILFEYIRRIGESYQTFVWFYGLTLKQAVALEGIDSIREAVSSHVTPEGSVELPANWQELQICELAFDYEDDAKQKKHLTDINIKLPRKGKVLFIGESGSGKSTVLALLRGIYLTDHVEVLCDGQPLKQKLFSLAKITTLLQQEPEIFAGTIRFNITFGMNASDDQISRCVKLARFDSVLAELPNGLDSRVAEKGVNLSGGERQRLALARGLFFAEDSEIILLDEATSHLDPKNESLIYAGLLQELAEKCVVSVSHRRSLIPMFDYVYEFEDGRIIQHGAPDKFLRERADQIG